MCPLYSVFQNELISLRSEEVDLFVKREKRNYKRVCNKIVITKEKIKTNVLFLCTQSAVVF